MPLHLSSIAIHPLKSCAPLPLAQAALEPRGLAHDRRWMAVDPDGRFITGRQVPALVRIEAVPDAEGLALSAPGVPSIRVPVPPRDAARAAVVVWRDTVDAALAGPEADTWLSQALGRPARLVHMDARAQRAVDPDHARPGDEVGFADGYPLLLVGQASLDALNARLPTPVPMARFRPNLVVAGALPHAEDGWRTIRIGGIDFEVAKPCTRCVFTTVDPASGSFDPSGQPLAELKNYRRTPKGITFGVNLIARGTGVLREGDAVEIVA